MRSLKTKEHASTKQQQATVQKPVAMESTPLKKAVGLTHEGDKTTLRKPKTPIASASQQKETQLKQPDEDLDDLMQALLKELSNLVEIVKTEHPRFLENQKSNIILGIENRILHEQLQHLRKQAKRITERPQPQIKTYSYIERRRHATEPSNINNHTIPQVESSLSSQNKQQKPLQKQSQLKHIQQQNKAMQRKLREVDSAVSKLMCSMQGTCKESIMTLSRLRLSLKV